MVDGLSAITPSKQRKLVRAAEAWLARFGPPEREVAFLVAVVSGRPAPCDVAWFDDPFDG
jgi:Holliday junction resolvase-like predicted endonuclease